MVRYIETADVRLEIDAMARSTWHLLISTVSAAIGGHGSSPM
jgi:hypothetical protein